MKVKKYAVIKCTKAANQSFYTKGKYYTILKVKGDNCKVTDNLGEKHSWDKRVLAYSKELDHNTQFKLA